MVGGVTKESSTNGSSSIVETKKKKRPRNRIRKRNKNYTAVVNGTTTAEVEPPPTSKQQLIEKILQPQESPTTKELKKIPHGNYSKENREKMKPSAPNEPPAVGNIGNEAPAAVPGKTRDQILAEREAKKLAKQSKKTKTVVETGVPATTVAPVVDNATPPLPPHAATSTASTPQLAKSNDTSTATAEKSREQIKAEREAKKQAKQSAKVAKNTIVPPAPVVAVGAVAQQLASVKIDTNVVKSNTAQVEPTSAVVAQEEKKKPTLSKAERRAIQEAQRAVKAQKSAPQKSATNSVAKPATKKTAPTAGGGNTEKCVITSPKTVTSSSPSPVKTSTTTKSTTNDCKVKLFNHLKSARKDVSLFVNNPLIHPTIARLGEQYAQRTIVGSNARCIAFLNALKMVIQDFETPPKKEFSRSLETSIKNCVEHLQKCRPLAVSVTNAYKHIKHVLTQLPTDKPESELKEHLCHFIDTYIENQIGKAAQAISSSMQEKIINGDVILTFGCSSLINYICEEAHRRHVDFRVIVVDSRPFCEGQELLRRLTNKEIPCTYVLINALGFVMPEATKVLLGAHALLSNGYVMARTGTAQVALVARAFNVPVLVCCETHKFSESFQTDAIVYNELGNPEDLVMSDKCCLSNWQAKNKMSPLNLIYDITPPELVTAVVTEVSILPCTSVPVILRIKPTEIGYYS